MSEDIQGLERFNEAMDALIGSIRDGGQRRRLLYRVAKRLLQLNRARMGAQQTPEGTPFVPRKPRPGAKAKSGAMFKKLRSPAWLKARSGNEGAFVGFEGAGGAIASIHHFGLRAKIDRRAKRLIQYTARPLLGLSDSDVDILEEALFQHFQHVVK